MASLAEIRQKYPQYSDMSDAELAGAFHKKFYSDMPVDEFNKSIGYSKEKPRLATERLQGMSTPKEREAIPSQMESYWSGATALPKGAFQLGANIGDFLTNQPEGAGYGDAVNRTLHQQALERKKRREAVGREGFDARELAGAVGPAMGIKSGLELAPKLNAVGEPIKQALLKRMASGAGQGGLYGAAMPVTNADGNFAEDKVKQALLGTAVGGGLPVVGDVAKVGVYYGNEFRKPFTHKGVAQDVEKFAQESFASGKDKIVNALHNAKSGETSAQAVARANRLAKTQGKPASFGDQVAATERGLSKKTHGGDILKTIYDKQQSGREKIIDSIAGTPQAYKVAEGVRSANAAKNYAEAFNQIAKGNPELAKIAQNPYFKEASRTAEKVMKARDKNIKTDLIEYLHMIKKGIDKQLNKQGDEALAGVERAESMKLKEQLTKWMSDKTSGAYAKARDQFAKDSIPLNQMDTGKIIKDAMVNPSEVESVAPYLKAVKDAPKTLKNATGFKGYDKLDDVLTGEQVKGVNKVTDAMLNEVKRNKMAGRGENMLKELSGEVKFELPHILSRPIVVANAVLKKIGQDKTPEYREVLAKIMANPKELERILLKPGTSKDMEIAQDIVQQLSKAGPISAAKQAGE